MNSWSGAPPLSKAHAASSLGLLNSLRDDNDFDTYGTNNNTKGTTRPHRLEHVKSSSSTSSSSSSSINSNKNSDAVSTSSSSRMKNSFINVFSLKQKVTPETCDATNHHDNLSMNNSFHIPSYPQAYANNTNVTCDHVTLNFNSSNHNHNHSHNNNHNHNHNNSNTDTNSPNIFKKIISRKALLPRMKAFKRIANDMEVESFPLYDEMHHELMITTAMKEENLILNSCKNNQSNCYSSLLSIKNNSKNLLNQDNLKKFEIINKANESWSLNRRKSSSSLTNSESHISLSRRNSISNTNLAPLITANSSNTNLGATLLKRRASVSSLTPTNTNMSASTTTTTNTNSNSGLKTATMTSTNTNTNTDKSRNSILSNPFQSIRKSRKRKVGYGMNSGVDDYSTDFEEYLSDDGNSSSSWNPMINCKRRLVSGSVTNSPKSPALDPFPSRRNSVMLPNLQSTSDDFEHMSLK